MPTGELVSELVSTTTLRYSVTTTISELGLLGSAGSVVGPVIVMNEAMLAGVIVTVKSHSLQSTLPGFIVNGVAFATYTLSRSLSAGRDLHPEVHGGVLLETVREKL